MPKDLKERLKIESNVPDDINRFLLGPDNPVIDDVIEVVKKYGTPEQINEKAKEARKLPNLMARLEKLGSPYVKDLKWLTEQRDNGAFVSIPEYRKRVMGSGADSAVFDETKPVTLEISAFQYFPWLIVQAERAIEKRQIMPGRFIRVRRMKEQEQDGDLIAVAAAMQIVGATYVETLDTKGTDGSNIHLGGPDTITGYFGGIGQPNDHPLKWLDEYLYYYTEYGVEQVLNINPGTVFIAYLLYKLGIDNAFKISVFMGNDNPYAVLWTLLGAKLFSRPDGSTPLEGFNLANSVNRETLEKSGDIRHELGFDEQVRIEHHITETWKSIVIQPYDRRDDLLAVAKRAPNISAKHEGGDVDVEPTLDHPSDILDYFREKAEVESSGEMHLLERNYLEKHEAVNRTAEALTKNGLSFIAARRLHSLS